MPSLIWSPRALDDLARLHAFVATRNTEAAERAIRAIRRGVSLLRAHPQIGRPVDGLEPAFRDWWIPYGDGGYVVRYRTDGRGTIILTVRHGKEAGF